MAPRVWVAAERDTDAVAGLMAAFRDWLGHDKPEDDAIRRVAAELLRDPATEYLLAASEPGAPPAGVCQLRFRLSIWTGAEDCWLEDLYVEDGARRSGLGRALVQTAVERARARGCRRIELDANEQNPAALALYRSMGFTTEPKPPGRTLFLARRLDS